MKDFSGQFGLEINRDHFNYSGKPVTDDQWHHVAASYDGNEQRLYLDGQPCGPVVRWHGDIPATACDLIVGNHQRPSPGSDGFDGLIDELRIYNRALSADGDRRAGGTREFQHRQRRKDTAAWATAVDRLLAGSAKDSGVAVARNGSRACSPGTATMLGAGPATPPPWIAP